jgi:hypothetical protein
MSGIREKEPKLLPIFSARNTKNPLENVKLNMEDPFHNIFMSDISKKKVRVDRQKSSKRILIPKKNKDLGNVGMNSPFKLKPVLGDA